MSRPGKLTARHSSTSVARVTDFGQDTNGQMNRPPTAELSDAMTDPDGNGDDQPRLTRRRLLAIGGAAGAAGGVWWVFRPAPVTDRPGWHERANLPTARGEMKGATLDSNLYVPGGMSGIGTSTDEVSVYAPSTNEWEPAAPLPVPLNHHASAVVNGRLYVLGGNESFSDPPERHAYAYEPDTDTWGARSPLPDGRWAHEAVSIGDLIFVVGGVPETDDPLDTLVYDTTTDSWERRAPIPTPREHLAAATVNDDIIVIGGRWDGENSDACQVYDPDDDEWRMGAPLPTARSGFGAAVLDGRVHVIGGEDPSVLDGWTTAAHEIYDVGEDVWSAAAELPLPVHGNVVGQLDDRIYVAGGAWRQGAFSVTSWSEHLFAFDPAV